MPRLSSRRIASGLAAAMLAVASPALAEPFTLFVYETAGDLALRDGDGPETAAYWRAYAAFAAAATEAGVLRGGAPLHVGPETMTTLSRDGEAQGAVSTGALALGGYFQIDVADRGAALAWAARLPAAAVGAVEVRAGHPAPAM